ncbi:MAG TPA: hypothetical protein VF115_06620 [Acidimicrobiia bacterium]
MAYRYVVDIEASARKHDVSDEDMLRGDDVHRTIAHSRASGGVVSDEEGAAVIHAMKARDLEGWWTK